MPISRRVRLISLSAFCFLGFAIAAQAQQLDSSDQALKEVAERSAAVISSGSAAPKPVISRREDLEKLLESVEMNKTNKTKKVYFFERQFPSSSDGDMPPASIVAVARSAAGPEEIFEFDGSDGAIGLLGDFNRMISGLSLAIPNARAFNFAQLFLESCAAAGPGKIMRNEDGVRLDVQDYYLRVYANVWDALDAYSDWWHGFQATTPPVTPEIVSAPGGGYRVSLTTLVIVDGRHPQVQRLDLDVASNGRVDLRGIHTIFPSVPRWLFYDFSLSTPATPFRDDLRASF